MADRLHFTLVSPERELFSGPVDQVIVPGTLGDFGVLPKHAPFMSTIRPGAITIMDGATRRRIFIDGGFADVTPSGLTILAEKATELGDFDKAALEANLAAARDALARAGDEFEADAAKAALARAEAAITALSDKSYG
jgi:F-type H+-transporting ATPase subunit epsilon